MATTARRTYPAYYASRTACFGSSVGIPAAGWAYLGGTSLTVPALPGVSALAILAAFVLAGLLVIPALFVTLVCFAPDLPKMCVPRSWRAVYRNRTDRYGAKKRSRGQQKSSYISTRLKDLVPRIDRYRCVGCGARGAHDVDHRIPWAWGGLTILWNCFTLCERCNRVIKVDYWEDWRGRPHFGHYFNRANQAEAHRIFRRESGLRGRWNPFRLFRLAWALGT